MQELLRQLPKVDELLQREDISLWVNELSHKLVVDSLRVAIGQVRSNILNKKEVKNVLEDVLTTFQDVVGQYQKKSLRRVLNGTGIVLHTNLGRAKLAESAREQVEQVASSYSTLEYSVEKRSRGSRYDHVIELIKEITGAEDALVVNNNAAAVLLALNTLAKGKEAIVSRGQLIEIGGSFRIPAVMEQGGCILKEVGTTNKTHYEDYENAINENTGLILKVHTSNYRILGFTEEVPNTELVKLSEKYDVPVLDDLGSGMFINPQDIRLSYEPTVPEVVKAGVDVVTFSGDKLLGGPQAGIIVGKAKYIQAMKQNQLNRALRIDKLTLAALEATLKLYLDKEVAINKIPTLRMLNYTQDELRLRAEKLKIKILELVADYAFVQVADTIGQVGGGAMPLEELPSSGVIITPRRMSVNKYEERVRLSSTPLIARIENEGLLVDLRTISEVEEDILIDILKQGLMEG